MSFKFRKGKGVMKRGIKEGERSPDLFILKLHNLVTDRSTDQILSWGAERNSIVIRDRDAFVTEILGKLCKAKRYDSFVRQLNAYVRGEKRLIKIFGKIHSFV